MINIFRTIPAYLASNIMPNQKENKVGIIYLGRKTGRKALDTPTPVITVNARIDNAKNAILTSIYLNIFFKLSNESNALAKSNTKQIISVGVALSPNGNSIIRIHSERPKRLIQ